MPHIIDDTCLGYKCALCVPVCPVDCIHLDDALNLYVIDDTCVDCMHCDEACPIDSAQFVSKERFDTFHEELKVVKENFQRPQFIPWSSEAAGEGKQSAKVYESTTLQMRRYVAAPGQSVRVHRFDNPPEVTLVVAEGSCRLEQGGEVYPLQQGSIVVVRPQTPYTIVNDGQTPLSLIASAPTDIDRRERRDQHPGSAIDATAHSA